jgi:hypothetical protein
MMFAAEEKLSILFFSRGQKGTTVVVTVGG